ncbi:Ig-like domain-containing protein [Mycolicibacterium duvalii]|uniref:Ig-like domain-containing protein n=1 Tax=Mycolicibacterium duvalii TaxID=39688 RepID=UPI001054DCAC|nr:Ig-like domain-containing protein [Mycolicibacterium duvalii]MCV7370355.1 tandem-95 repeat protein [Mycolicibacterium duvalii]
MSVHRRQNVRRKGGRILMGYAQYVGRVGALAVSLGIGAAVATGHGIGLGIAAADETGKRPSIDARSNPPAPSRDAPMPSTDRGDLESDESDVDLVEADSPSEDTSVDAPMTVDEDPVDEIDSQAPAPEPAPRRAARAHATVSTPARQDDSRYANPDASATERVHTPLFSAQNADDVGTTGDRRSAPSTATTEHELVSATIPAAPAPLKRQPVGPVEATLGAPGAIFNIAATAVSMLLAPFIAPAPTAPARPPLTLFALLGWVRREIQRTFFNRTPNAVVDEVTTSEGLATTIPVLANDIDADGDVLTVTRLTQPEHGTVVLNADGTITYTPDGDFFGTDSFTYRVSDAGSPWHIHGLSGFFAGGGHAHTGQVNVTVTAVNDAPVAVDDAVTTAEDTAVSGHLLDNDNDVDTPAAARSAALATGPTNGTVVVGPTGTYTYTPNAHFHGTDEFTYTLSDGDLTDIGKVAITVTPVNDAPVAAADTVSIAEDTHANHIDVLANDTDHDTDDTHTVHAVTDGANGTVVNNGTSVLYTPNPDFRGTDSFTYTTIDSAGATSTATVTVNVSNVNDTPTAVPDAFTTAEDTPVTLDVLDNDTDPDEDGLGRELVTAPGHGTLTEINDGPDAGAWIYTPAPDFHGTDSFTYRAVDGTEHSNTVTVTITVTAVNDAPVAYADTYATAQNTPLIVAVAGGVLANDSDPDASDPDDTPLTAIVVDHPDHGTLVLNPDGSFTYTPVTNYHGTDTFTYTVFDSDLAGNTATVTVTVDAVASPITANDDVYTGLPGDNIDVSPTANDTTELTSPLGRVTIVAGPANGRLFETLGRWTYSSLDDFVGTDTFTYVVADSSDPTVVSNTATVTINVVRPIVANDDAYTAVSGAAVALTPAVTANDTTVLDRPFGPITILTGPKNGQLFDDNGVLTYRSWDGFLGTDSFTYTVPDMFNSDVVSNVATVVITVVPYNPLTAVDDAYAILGRATVLTPTANDTSDLSRPLGAITIVDGPSNGTLTQTGGTLTYTPTAGYVGADSFTYTVGDSVDSTLESNTATVTLTVIAYNPILATDDAFTIPFDTPTALTPGLTVNDTSDLGNPLGAITITDGPANGTLTNVGGTFTYTPNAGYSGTDTFTYTVADSVDPAKVSVPATVTLTVSPYSPILARNDVYTVLSGNFATRLLPAITANDTNTISERLGAISIVTAPTHGTIIERDGVLTYSPFDDYTGIDSFTYTVADSGYPNIVSNPATVTLIVVDSLPVFANDDNLRVFTNEPLTLTPTITRNDGTAAGNEVGAISVLSQPVNGTLTETNGTLIYTPNTNFNGVDSFVYTVADSADPTVVSLPAQVTLTVSDPIAATNDFYWVSANVTTTLSPAATANDVTYTGNALGAPVFSAQPLGGTVTVVGNTWVFTPRAGFTGLTTLGYTVADSVNPGWKDSAIVFITVSAD